MKSIKFLLLITILWLAAFTWSFFAAYNVEGPRNIDTGFQRLDLFFRWQLASAFLAILSAVIGLAWFRQKKSVLSLALAPLGLMLLMVVGIALFAVWGPTVSNSPAGNVSSEITTAPVTQPEVKP